MNNIKFQITIIISLILNTLVYSQDSLITIIENDRDGNYKTKDGEIKKEYENNKIVDINSILKISLDYELLITDLSKEEIIGLPIDHHKKIKKLIEAMKLRNQNLNKFQDLLKNYDYEAFKNDSLKNKAWAAEMQKVTFAIDELTQIDEYIDFGPGGYRPEAIYNRTGVVLDRMKNEVIQYAQNKGIYIQFGAWLYTRHNSIELHLPNFDSIAPQPSYEVERWQILPTEDQLEELEKLQEVSSDNKNKGIGIINELIEVELNRLKGLFTADFNQQIRELKTTLERIKTTELIPIINDIEKIENDLENFRTEIGTRILYYKELKDGETINLYEVLAHVKKDVAYIEEDGKRILFELESIVEKIKGGILKIKKEALPILLKEIEGIKRHYQQWYAIITQELKYSNLITLLKGNEIDFKTLAFSEAVIKHSIKNLPSKTTLDLYTTGRRNTGDRIAFKFEVKNKEKTILEKDREVYVYNILPHIEGTVGVIFADPLAHTEVQTQFQMAPYYNMLLKGLFDQKLRRKSVLYNKFFDFGIGLHISAPDFNGDDVPELGTGMAISMLHDYIQTGIAVNIFTGDPYWFFGLRIPVPSFNIGGVPFTRE